MIKKFNQCMIIVSLVIQIQLNCADLGKTEECSRAYISPNAFTLLEDQIIENKSEPLLTAKLFKYYQLDQTIDSEYEAGAISQSQKDELKAMLPH